MNMIEFKCIYDADGFRLGDFIYCHIAIVVWMWENSITTNKREENTKMEWRQITNSNEKKKYQNKRSELNKRVYKSNNIRAHSLYFHIALAPTVHVFAHTHISK